MLTRSGTTGESTVSRQDDGATRPEPEAMDGTRQGEALVASDPAGREGVPAIEADTAGADPATDLPSDSSTASLVAETAAAAEGETGDAVNPLTAGVPVPFDGTAPSQSGGEPVAMDGSASTAGNGQVEGTGIVSAQPVAAGGEVSVQAAAAAEPPAAGTPSAESPHGQEPRVAGRALGAYADPQAPLGRPRIQPVPVDLHGEVPGAEAVVADAAGAVTPSAANPAELTVDGPVTPSDWLSGKTERGSKDLPSVAGNGEDHARVVARQVLASMLAGVPPGEGASEPAEGRISAGVAHAAAVLNLPPGEAPSLRQGQRWLEAALQRNGGDFGSMPAAFERLSAIIAGDGTSGTGRRGGDREAAPGWPASRATVAAATAAAGEALFSLPGLAPLAATSATGPVDGGAVTMARDIHLTQQVVRAVSIAWRGQTGEAHVRLAPEHLGEVRVSLTVTQGSVTATLQAETPAARAWIQAHEDDLRKGLQEQGLSLERLVVKEDGERRGGQQEQEAPPHPRPRRQRTELGAEVPQFELEA